KPQSAPSPVYGGGGPRAAWRRGRPHAPLPAARHPPRLNDPLGSLGQSRKAITPQSALPPLHGEGRPAKVPGRDPGMGGRPLAPAPGRGALTALSSVMAGRDPATQPNAQHAWEDQPVRPGPADQKAQKERHSNAVAPDRFHRRARLHGRRQQAGVRDHRQRTSREGSLDAEPAPTPLTPPFRHPRARPGGPAMSLRPPAPASGVGLSQVTGPTIRAPTGDRATAPRTHLTTC